MLGPNNYNTRITSAVHDTHQQAIAPTVQPQPVDQMVTFVDPELYRIVQQIIGSYDL
jgi:hypothetical protein